MKSVSMDKWQRAQELEREYHKNDQWRRSPAFMEDTGRLFEWMGFEQDQFRDNAILDVGCGLMRRTNWFSSARWIDGIEPMAETTIAFPDGGVVASAAETYIADCYMRYQAVFCINVLDHCYDPAKVIENCIAYLALGGILCLSVDICDTTDEMHPAVIVESEVDEMLSGLTIERKQSGLPNSPHYGRGEAVTWIARN